jgi:hypothetical protein
MIEPINAILGGGIIVLNAIPFVIKKPKYLFLTILISFFIILLLLFSKYL